MPRLMTQLVHPPRIAGESTGATSTPIFQTATFATHPGQPSEWDYSRSGNPTRSVLEQQLCQLDDADDSLAYASGLAAVRAVLQTVAPGHNVVVGNDLYGGTQRLLRLLETQSNLVFRRVNSTQPEAFANAIDDRTDLVLIESPTNPRLQTIDVAALGHDCRQRGVRLAVDNTMLSPLLQRPLAQGADFAVQSATKLLSGHSDLTAGVVSVRSPDLAKLLRFRQNAEGTALAPFESWLLLRGLQTLSVRIQVQQRNTARILSVLRHHPRIERLYYPSTPPAGTVISFETGSRDASRHVVQHTRWFHTTVSFGGVASSISLPCEMSHASVPAQDRDSVGLAPDLIRLSIGIEDAEDLIADLRQALDSMGKSTPPRRSCIP